jgi:flagellar biosynthesis/type III secretory pathway protein FliH
MTSDPARPDEDVRPFLPTRSGGAAPRPLGDVLPGIAIPPAISPWSPRAVAEPAQAPVGPSAAELSQIYEQARETGRAEGLAETAALRELLSGLVDALSAARAELAAPAAEVIAELTSCVIETWTERAERAELFAPIVRGWVARAPDQPATARVHPEDVAALTAAIGPARLAIVGDPAVAPGAIEIRSPGLELSHDWRSRLPDLRMAIESALTGAES